MKKIFPIFILMATLSFVSSCENEKEAFLPQESKQRTTLADLYYVPYETALAIAEKKLDSELTTRATAPSAREVADHREYIANLTTRSADDSISVRFHIINFKDDQGFALVSADSRTTSVYAYSDTGNLDIEDAIANTGFGEFMEDAIEYYKNEVANYAPKKIPPFQPSPTDSIDEYGDIPLLAIEELDGTYYHVRYGSSEIAENRGCVINAQWHQQYPYNYYCDAFYDDNGFFLGRGLAGCGPIASAQIMSYYKHPASVSGTTFDWDLITTSPSYTMLSPASLATANLIKKVGEAANATYGLEATSTNIYDVSFAFFLLGYTHTGPESFKLSKVTSSLSAGSPVLVRGENDQNTGHAWIIDSYKKYRTLATYYYTYPPYNVYKQIYYYDPAYYCHYNWGWGASYNGWYINAVDDYSNKKKIMYNFSPNL